MHPSIQGEDNLATDDIEKAEVLNTFSSPQSSEAKPAPRPLLGPVVSGKERAKEWGQQLLREAGCIQMHRARWVTLKAAKRHS